jgi:hypothetical protein
VPIPFPVLTGLSVIDVFETGPAVTPVNVPLIIALDQEYVELATLIVGVKLNAPAPLHIVVVNDELVISG